MKDFRICQTVSELQLTTQQGSLELRVMDAAGICNPLLTCPRNGMTQPRSQDAYGGFESGALQQSSYSL